MVEEITIGDLLKEFKVRVDLPEHILKYELDGDFLKADLGRSKDSYVFTVDDIVMTITPEDKQRTVSYLVIVDDKVIGGVILGYDTFEYLN